MEITTQILKVKFNDDEFKNKLNDLCESINDDMQKEIENQIFAEIFNTYNTFDNDIATITQATETSEEYLNEMINRRKF